MIVQKIRIMTEDSLTTAVPPLVAQHLVDDPAIRDQIITEVGQIAAEPGVLGQTFPTYASARRLAAGNTGAVVLILDDGRADNYEIAAPLVEAVGGRLTLALTTDRIDSGEAWITSTQIRDLAARGHEMAWHSKSHVSMPEESASVRAVEWAAKETIEGILAGVDDRPVSTAVYPGNGSTEATNREAWGRFERVFVGQNHPYFSGRTDPVFQRGRASWSTPASQPRILELVRQAAATGSVLSIFSHSATAGSAGNIETWQLEELCALTEELGIPMLTARDAFPATAQPPNGGFELPDLEAGFYVRRNLDAGNTIESVADTPQTGFPGARSLRITGDGTTNPQLLIAYPPTPVREPGSVSVSARVRMSRTGGSGPGAYVAVEQRDMWNSDLGTLTGPYVSATQAWGGYKFDFTPHEECAHFRIALGLDRVAGSVWWDHLHTGPTRYGALG